MTTKAKQNDEHHTIYKQNQLIIMLIIWVYIWIQNTISKSNGQKTKTKNQPPNTSQRHKKQPKRNNETIIKRQTLIKIYKKSTATHNANTQPKQTQKQNKHIHKKKHTQFENRQNKTQNKSHTQTQHIITKHTLKKQKKEIK